MKSNRRLEMLTVEKLNNAEIGEQIPFSGKIQVIRNAVTKFHSRGTGKRFRVVADLNIVVRIV